MLNCPIQGITTVATMIIPCSYCIIIIIMLTCLYVGHHMTADCDDQRLLRLSRHNATDTRQYQETFVMAGFVTKTTFNKLYL